MRDKKKLSMQELHESIGFEDKPTKKQLMQDLKDEIVLKCCHIEELARGYSLPLSKVTVIARDPNNDKMYVVVTNESDGELKVACDLALKVPATIIR